MPRTRGGDLEHGLLGGPEPEPEPEAALSRYDSRAREPEPKTETEQSDAMGSGALGQPRSVQVGTDSARHRASLEDRGVRGAVLSWEGGELPLSFAAIKRDGTTLTVTVSEAVHPDCSKKGTPIAFASSSAAEAEAWQVEIQQAIEWVNSRHWGISKSFIQEQRDRWEAERMRCKGATVAEYFQTIGLGSVFDEQWVPFSVHLCDFQWGFATFFGIINEKKGKTMQSWCSGVLSVLQAKEQKSAADEKEIAYYTRKVNGTEPYEEMELTDYMNVLKHQDLAPVISQLNLSAVACDLWV